MANYNGTKRVGLMQTIVSKEWVMSIRKRLILLIAGSVAAGGVLVACVAETGSVGDVEAEAATSRQAEEVPATAATVNGTCARPDEVGWGYPDVANMKVAGGWTTALTAGNGVKYWNAEARIGCSTFAAPAGGANANKVVCYYQAETFGGWVGPQLSASKTFPSNYKCTCNQSTFKYQCIRQ